MASMAIFGDPVTLTQYFGYSIALGGLMYYRLGGEKMKQLGTDTRLAIGEFQRKNPAALKQAITFVIAVIVIGVVVGLFAILP